MQEIQYAAQRATTLTRQLLIFSRQQVRRPQKIDVNAAVLDIHRLLQRILGENIDLVLRLHQHLDLVIADPHQIEQVILNLAINARDAMPNGGTFVFETTQVDLDEQHQNAEYSQIKPGSYIRIIVSDTGIGMDSAILQRIFEPFFTTKEIGKGSGLGLATVHGIVQQSNGYILARSEPQAGSTFEIYLPRAETHLMLHHASERAEIRSQTPLVQRDSSIGRHTILIVEDDALVLELIHRVLHQSGCVTMEARNGEQALALLQAAPQQVDVVLTDIVMPYLNGGQLIDQLRSQQPQIKIICMSGYADQTVLHQQIIQRCDGFLQKPFTPHMLVQCIEDTLQPASSDEQEQDAHA